MILKKLILNLFFYKYIYIINMISKKLIFKNNINFN